MAGVIEFLKNVFDPKTNDGAGRSLRDGAQSLLDGKREEDQRNDQRRAEWTRQDEALRRENQARIDRNLAPATSGRERAEEGVGRFRDENEKARLVANRGPDVAARAPLRGRDR